MSGQLLCPIASGALPIKKRQSAGKTPDISDDKSTVYR